jgi:hypothetical protein
VRVSAIVFLTTWANSPFAVAIGAVGVFALLQATGLLGLIAGGGEGDHDVDADHDVDVDHDVDADADHDAEGDHGADHDHDGPGERGLAAVAAGVLGFGTLPLSILWQTFALGFGAAGFAMNFRYFERPGGPPIESLLWTLPAAFAVGCVATAALNKTLGPVLSSKGQEATSRAQLVGQIGVVISSRVDHEFGEVRIRDKTGHDLRLVCKLVKESQGAPTEKQSVVVVDYDEKGGILVAPLDGDDEGVGVGDSSANDARRGAN